MSQALRDARRYEEALEKNIRPEERPAYHLSARVGWMNDPNGFSFYLGKYHLFYQYHPYDSHWGPIHWGHAVSDDLIHWEYQPAAMAPDAIYDRDGCFSGSAVTMPDGRQLLMYTGVVLLHELEGPNLQIQTQCVAIGDGLDYLKYEGNPVLTEKDLPEGGSRYGFRDPKIWRREDGTYRALIANDMEGEGGQLLLYQSNDAVHWEFRKVFCENHNRIGKMWECPDFFELDGEYILMVSSQDMLPKDLEYHNGDGSFYMLGEYDPETETFREKADYAVDYGIDFYAPQTILAPDGRRIMIGWMQNWDTCNLHVKSTPWFGQMSIPRELFIREGRLYQRPVRELESCRTDKVEYRDVVIDGEDKSLPGVSGRMIDLQVELTILEKEALFQQFIVKLAENDAYHTEIIYYPHEKSLKVDRKFSGSRRAIVHQRRTNVDCREGKLKLRMILDRFSIEVFVNDGEKVLSTTIYTDADAEGISFYTDGKVAVNVVRYALEV